MPIIKPGKTKPEKVKFLMDSRIVSEVKDYCSWAKVDYPDLFFAQAAEFVLKKDVEWKKYKKNKKLASKSK